MTPCSSVRRYRRLGEICCLHLQGRSEEGVSEWPPFLQPLYTEWRTADRYCLHTSIEMWQKLWATLYNLIALCDPEACTEFLTEALPYTHQTTRRHKRKITISITTAVNTWTFVTYIILILNILFLGGMCSTNCTDKQYLQIWCDFDGASSLMLAKF